MVVELSRVRALDEIIGAGRHILQLGEIPGVTGAGPHFGSEGLMLKNCEITMPQITIGQVRAPILGYNRSFRGGLDHQNRFTAVFYEDIKGGTTRTFFNWLNQVRDFEDGTSGTQAEYAVDGYMQLLTSTGDTAYKLDLERVWPTVVTPTAASDEDTGPARIQVDFSFDWISIKDSEVAGVNSMIGY